MASKLVVLGDQSLALLVKEALINGESAGLCVTPKSSDNELANFAGVSGLQSYQGHNRLPAAYALYGVHAQ
eukprot:1155585-Pelagomonas_calceolata.AAC.5